MTTSPPRKFQDFSGFETRAGLCVCVCVCGQPLGIRQDCHADTQQVRSEGSLIPSIIKADLRSVRNLICSLNSRAACRHTAAFAFIEQKYWGNTRYNWVECRDTNTYRCLCVGVVAWGLQVGAGGLRKKRSRGGGGG